MLLMIPDDIVLDSSLADMEDDRQQNHGTLVTARGYRACCDSPRGLAQVLAC